MQRYTTHDIVDLMLAEDGEIVLHSEARAEIERLKKEVAEARKESASYHDAYEGEKIGRAIDRDTSWNDAIEAAAETASEWWAYMHDDQDRDGPVAAAIRALKRSQE